VLSSDILTQFGGPRLSEQVSASVRVADRRAQAEFRAGSFEASVSRYGCFEVSLGELYFRLALPGGSCVQHVSVEDQDFYENDGTAWVDVVVRTERPAERDLKVWFTATAAPGVTVTTGSPITIARGASTGKIPLRIDGDNAWNAQAPVRSFTVTITGLEYVPDGFWDIVPQVDNDRDTALVTIHDDDAPLPVFVSVPGTASVAEGEQGRITLSATNLLAGDSVMIGWSLVPQDPSLANATSGADFRLGLVRRVRLTADEPVKTITFDTIEDRLYELNEALTLQFRVIR
jgi:hypothetical protein